MSLKKKKEENILSQISKPEIKQDVSKDIIKKKDEESVFEKDEDSISEKEKKSIDLIDALNVKKND